MIDSNYKLSLDSIDSNMNLSFDKFKKVTFNKSNYYDELIPYFYKDLPAETAFSIKYDNDVDTMSNDFSSQYDEIYQYGARNIIDNKNYTEEYEYFSPLYITKTGLPKKFIIFRVDGPGIGTLSSANFKTEISNKLKTVKIFDLTKESILGEWLNTNFIDNKYFPDAPLEIDFRNLEFCRWNGIDYQNGGYTSKSLFIDDILDEEKEIFELEKFVFDSYKTNKVVFPNILNLSFLFDDTPSTPEQKRKWSINRYYGFYLDDLELVTTMSPYIPIPLKSDVIIEVGNIIYSQSDDYPFIEAWSDKKPFYVEYYGNYYKVEQFTETITNQLTKIKNSTTNEDRMSRDLGFSSSKTSSSVKMVSTKVVTTNTKSAVENYSDVIVTKYRIISNLDLTGKQLELNKNYGEVDVNNRLINFNNDDFYINGFYTEETKVADIWLIEIDGILHNLIKDGSSTKIYSDYSFDFSNVNDFVYKVAGISKKVDTIVDFNNPPKLFKIYKAKLTDIKDFDDRIIDTEFSKYEYESSSDITKTDETKMYFDDLNSKTNPRELDDFIYKNEVVKIPVASEYTANSETFKIDGNNLSEIWRKNSSYCRFGFQNSLSANDVPYLLNNSLIFEDYNRTSNPSHPDPIRIERNLDYFYTINSSTSSYVHHTLHIEKLDSSKNIDNTFRFELDKYLNIATYSLFNEVTSTTQSATYSFDYFNYIFGKEIEFLDGKIKKNTNKYSYFNIGDDSIPNHSLFRGIKFDIYSVDGINLNSNNQIDKINISTNNNFNDYKLSILLSDNDSSVTNTGHLISSTNSLSWDIIDEWKMDKEYPANSYVIFDDMLYKNSTTSSVSKPTHTINGIDIISNPFNKGWSNVDATIDNIFWNPNVNYDINNLKIVYNYGEYYYFDTNIGLNIVDFWKPIIVGYNKGNFVLYKNKFYISIIDNNLYNPIQSGWLETSNIKKWQITNIYSKSDVVISNGDYYMANIDTKVGDILGNSDVWLKIVDGLTSSPVYKWKPIEIWNPSKSYGLNYVVYNDIVYKGLQSSIPVNEIPTISSLWLRVYSLLPDTNFKYNDNDNSIIKMNDKYYRCNSTTTDSTLDNGIIIYINKKWKNVLININIADNTYNNISETNRDDLYNELYKKITASNFISSINDITNKYGFSDYVSYVIIEEDGTLNRYSYDNNIKNLPYILKCEGPDSLDVKVQSLLKRPVLLPNTLNPYRKLDNGEILNINQLNYYNNNAIASNIIENQYPPKVFENYHGSKNIVSNTIYRFSGYYTPLFYNIDLFKRDSEFKESGNYLFDTSLTNFGIMKERKIRKINRKGSILKLKDVLDEKSIYPMLDEFGYSIYDFFIFSSTWDLKYYLETDLLSNNGNKDYLQKYTIDENVINNFDDIEIPTVIPSNIGPS